ncbi:SRPBCC family protein [Qaidamihabitans albus]|uniref:SRPBCC family protein n=1 Tax=Qaidamihabitans albus TaxID=2795733 RepID=UPI0018F24D0E|nr:SRPBCC family protein [Qaidamihabitans albus]
MLEFTETISIHARPSTVWDVMRDIEGWWLASNPEHETLERLDDRDVLEVGARLRIRERIGGIPGEATGTITQVEPGSAVTWEAEARYRWLGVPVSVEEGVTWRVEPHDRDGESAKLSAHVWATFPPGLRGRLLEAAFTHLLGGVDKDREHARTELRYLKGRVEQIP